MKTFIKKIIVFALLMVVFIESFCFFLKLTDLYLINYPGSEIYFSIEKSNKIAKSKTLLLGDSVGNQLFPNETNNEVINSLACNQGIGMIGQYLLLNNYLNAGNEVDRVILLFTPLSFRSNLDQKWTYHYFLKPFYNSGYTHLFTTTVKEQIRKIPYHQFVQIPHVFVTSWAPQFNLPDQNSKPFLSPISLEYLEKIKELSIKYSFELKILPTPTNIENKGIIEKMNIDDISMSPFENEFKNYFKKIKYLDSKKFSDGTHLNHPESYTELYRTELMK